jgi:hypothetical protein
MSASKARPRPHLAPLADVRPELAPAMRDALPRVGEAIIAAIRDSVPEYAQPLEGAFGRNVRVGVGEALRRFVADIDEPGADFERWRLVYFNLGRGELRQGRTLEALLGAYRVGARVSWRRIAETAAEGGATQAELTSLAEAIFAYIDEISAISAEGYAAEQAVTAGEAQRLRERALRALVDPAGSAERTEAACAAARWRAPETAAALLTREEGAAALAARLGQGVIAGSLGAALFCAVVPDADSPGRRAEIEGSMRGRAAAIGPTGPLADLPLSLDRARSTLALAEARALPSSSVLWANEHLALLITGQDQGLLAEHSRRELGPLEDETPASRERLTETLEAWLAHPARPTEVARAIHVHPQTARYRLRRLRELLGDIDGRERRFALELAVRGLDRPGRSEHSGSAASGARGR